MRYCPFRPGEAAGFRGPLSGDQRVGPGALYGLRYPEQRVLQKNDSRVYFRVLLELVTLCQEEGSIHPSHDPDQVVEELVVLHRGALFEWRIYEGRFDLPQLGRRMARQLLRGLHYAD